MANGKCDICGANWNKGEMCVVVTGSNTATLDLIDRQLDMSHLEDLTEEQALALAWAFDPNEPPPGVMRISSYAETEPEMVSISHWGMFLA